MNITNKALDETVASIRAQLAAAEQSVQAQTRNLDKALGKRRGLSRALRAAERVAAHDTQEQPLTFPPGGTLADYAKAWLGNYEARYSPKAEADETCNEGARDVWAALDRRIIDTPVHSRADVLGLLQIAIADMGVQCAGAGGMVFSDPGEEIAFKAISAAFIELLNAPEAIEPTASKIPELFRRWYAYFSEANVTSDAESEGLSDAGRAVEKAILAEPTVTASDLAMKLLAVTGNGDYALDNDFVNANIRPLAGVPQRGDDEITHPMPEGSGA